MKIHPTILVAALLSSAAPLASAALNDSSSVGRKLESGKAAKSSKAIVGRRLGDGKAAKSGRGGSSRRD